MIGGLLGSIEPRPINYEINGPPCSPQRLPCQQVDFWAFFILHQGPAVLVYKQISVINCGGAGLHLFSCDQIFEIAQA